MRPRAGSSIEGSSIRLGYNVAPTNPASDFIQSDEGWWLAAWSHEIAVGAVEYDDSAGVWSLDIAIRIDDPAVRCRRV